MKFIITVVSLFIAISLFAQPKIEFKNSTYDYGTIKEDDGLAQTVFEYTNTGDQPLVLNNVRATCGCTTPEWTKEPIAPGKSGSIKVAYNPKGRPGNFTKSINVYSNTQPSVNILTIKGTVSPHEKTLAEIYPKVMGPIRWKSNYLSMGSLLNNATKTEELDFVNTSDKSVTLGVHRSPDYVTISFDPEVIEPGEKGKMLLTYDANKKAAFGYVSDRIYLLINDEKENTYSIGVSATLKEDFSQLTEEELANAPVATFDNKVFDFGKITQGDKVKHDFKLTNDGKTDLLIRNVKTSCGCTAVKNENIVKPGETTNLSIEFNSRGKRNRQNKSITVITNDPKNSTTVLRIMGTVEVSSSK